MAVYTVLFTPSWVKTADEAIAALETGAVTVASLDHAALPRQ
jgi:hypothetical protein